MSYLLDKKNKRNNFIKIIIFAVLIFFLVYFRDGVFRGLATVSHTVFRPVLSVGSGISGKISNLSSYFSSKKALELQNEDLQSKLSEMAGRISNYNSLLADDAVIKEILGRKNAKTPMILAGILSKPNRSLYDTLVVDAGFAEGAVEGSQVFADGNVPIGKVESVYPHTSKIILFSTPGERIEVSVSLGQSLAGGTPSLGRDVSMELIGRGGGNFEMILPRDLNLPKGTEVVLPGLTPYVVGTVETIISDPRDAFQKALLVSPVNIEELKFVEIEK